MLTCIKNKPGFSAHASLPCTFWSQWQRINHYKNPPSQSDIDHQIRLLRHFIEIAEAILASGGHISFEWPRHCSGWCRPELIEFIAKHNLYTVNVDGCACGMTDSHGDPILKQWRFITSSERQAKSLSALRCEHPEDFRHAEISGSTTKSTERYPPKLCHTLLSSLFGH